jgi:mxaJ protein
MLMLFGDRTKEVTLKGARPFSNLAGSLSRVALAAGVLVAAIGMVAAENVARAQDKEFVGSRWIRVCADLANMPFSNEKGEGFENKLADLLAGKLGMQVVYTWLPQVTGFTPKRLGNDRCDVVMGYAQGTGLIEDTNPYYYTSYVLLYRQSDPSLAGVDNLSDERLKPKKIGIIARTPPASIMAVNGLIANAKPFEAMADAGSPSPAAEMIAEIAAGELDAGILWGPVGGYYAQASKVALTFVPLVKEKVGPRMIYGITLGVRPDEPEWKHKLNKLITENQGDINTILLGYSVPLLDEEGNSIEAAAAER